jgi:hypothetical protein
MMDTREEKDDSLALLMRVGCKNYELCLKKGGRGGFESNRGIFW